MGKLFHGKDQYSDEQLENEEFEDVEIIEEELDREDDIEDEEEVEGFENDSEENTDEVQDNSEDEEDFEVEIEDDNSGDDDDEDDSDEDDEDDDDRRTYRRKRRIRNQAIAYSIVLVILAVAIAGGVTVGRNIAGTLSEKRLAEEQAEKQAQLQARQEAESTRDVVIDAPEPIETEPESESEPESEIDWLGELVESDISEMPLEDKVAGLFIVTPEALTGVETVTQAGEGTQEALNEYAVGGLIYFSQNIVDEEQLREMLASTASMSRYPIFLAVDEEGGSVSRVAKSGIDVIQVGDMAEIGESGDAEQAYKAGLTIGLYLKDLGFNLDFAPVADVSDSENSVVGDRAFGSDPQLVADMVSNAVGGIEATGVSSCLKHFPGIGYTVGDTHSSRVEVTRTIDKMRGIDFIPFQAGIDAGADFVMVSHITVADTEEIVPSTLSKTIMTDILRDELGFEGIIITDALNMASITEYYTTEEAAVGAIAAGADMLLMPDDFHTAYNAVLAAVQDGTISEERINESLKRIYRVKYADKLN